MDDCNRCTDQQIACCCCYRPCRFCCRCLPTVKESTTTRLMYMLILFLATALMCALLSSKIQEQLINNYPNYSRVCIKLGAGENCRLLAGYMAVYRISLAVSLFFLILAILTIRTSSSVGCRAAIHNGFWGWKFLILCLACFGVFFIPSDICEKYAQYWMYIGMCGAFLFILVQLMLIVDFVHDWTDNWTERAEQNRNKWWYIGMIVCSLVIYTAVVVGLILIVVFYALSSECKLNRIVLGVNGALCLLCSFVSVLPTTEKYTGNATAGLLQSSVISAYVIFLTWTAFTSEPKPKDNDLCGPSLSVSHTSKDVVSYTSLAILFVLQICATIRTSNNLYKLGIKVPRPKQKKCMCCNGPPSECRQIIEDYGGQKLIKNEMKGVVYNYTFFHIMCCLSCLYIMMQLTHWFKPQTADLLHFEKSWDSVWIKLASSWACLLIYLITISLPRLCPGNLNRIRSAPPIDITGISLPEAQNALPNVSAYEDVHRGLVPPPRKMGQFFPPKTKIVRAYPPKKRKKHK